MPYNTYHVTLACAHKKKYVGSAVLLGEWLWCERCERFHPVVAGGAKSKLAVVCNTCHMTKTCGQDESKAERIAQEHARIYRHHDPYVIRVRA